MANRTTKSKIAVNAVMKNKLRNVILSPTVHLPIVYCYWIETVVPLSRGRAQHSLRPIIPPFACVMFLVMKSHKGINEKTGNEQGVQYLIQLLESTESAYGRFSDNHASVG